ncbi:hypothetical protein [Microbacterium sp. GXS0129]|uniref:hypothetical protein n=1 Tax=Microbacterium sp. GXS0129 TaxID=3377836 RepID=UPI00383B3936
MASGAEGEDALFDWQLKFAACMRGEGIDMPDPKNEDGGTSFSLPQGDQQAYLSAMETCTSKLGTPPTNDGRSDQQVLDDQLKTAKCLRDQGLTVNDPKLGQPMEIPTGASDAALKACGISFGG